MYHSAMVDTSVFRVVGLTAVIAGCATTPPPSTSLRASPASTSAHSTLPIATARGSEMDEQVAVSPVAAPLPPPPPPLVPPETQCDGKDEDGDGHPDMLFPSSQTACTTDAKERLRARIHRVHRRKSSLRQPLHPCQRSATSIDNDCNGIVDDVPPARVRPRALVVGPRYIWSETKSEVDELSVAFDQAGIPYDLQSSDEDWSNQVDRFQRYSLIVIPGYLEGASLTEAMREALESSPPAVASL